MSAWNVETTKYLVELYELQPCLYNVKSPLYHNKGARQRAIECITEELNLKFKCNFKSDVVLKKINGLRTQFNEARKQKLPTGTGSDDEEREEVSNKKKTWWLYENLAFLEQHMQYRKSSSSINKKQKIDVVPTASTSLENTAQDVLNDFNSNYWNSDVTEHNEFDEENIEIIDPHLHSDNDKPSRQGTSDTEGTRQDTPVIRRKRRRKEKQTSETAIALIAKSASDAMAAVAQKEEGYIEKSMKYLGAELESIRNPNTVRTLIRNFIHMVQEAQDAQDQA